MEYFKFYLVSGIIPQFQKPLIKKDPAKYPGAPNEIIVQNLLNIALLNVF